ncbi:MAG: transcription elongation factor GreA [Clostridiaceae bacterium]|nr:transcription elongation factor GreA [Clostridiaceae bacterium]
MQKEIKLTQDSLNELKTELEYLKTVREREVAEQIKEARSFGDLSENSEYDEAKNEQGKLYSRIAEIENIIAHVRIIAETSGNENVVGHGSKVVLQFLDDNSQDEYHIVGTQEVDPSMGRISDESPIGKAVMGKHKGDTVVIEAPSGHMDCVIVSVTR